MKKDVASLCTSGMILSMIVALTASLIAGFGAWAHEDDPKEQDMEPPFFGPIWRASEGGVARQIGPKNGGSTSCSLGSSSCAHAPNPAVKDADNATIMERIISLE